MNGQEPFADLVIRAVELADLDSIVATFRGLSAQSLHRRFFTLMPDPAPLVARHLAIVDHNDHEAFLVLDGDEVVAVAQWDRAPGRSAEAELAVLVADAWQSRGLGTVLIRFAAVDARRHGAATLTANVLTDNRPALRLAYRYDPSTVSVEGPETSFVFGPGAFASDAA